jgi:hypothetical protein
LTRKNGHALGIPLSDFVNSGMRKTATIEQLAMGRIRRTE